MSTGCGPDIMMHSLEDFLALILLVKNPGVEERINKYFLGVLGNPLKI